MANTYWEKLGKERREQIVDFIESYTREHGWPPSYREICAGVGLKSVSTVKLHIERLRRDGVIVTNGRNARSIRVVGR
jgi:repressor LexA